MGWSDPCQSRCNSSRSVCSEAPARWLAEGTGYRHTVTLQLQNSCFNFTSLALTPHRYLLVLYSGWPLITSWPSPFQALDKLSTLLYDSIEKAQIKKLKTIAYRYLFALHIKFGTKSWGLWHYWNYISLPETGLKICTLLVSIIKSKTTLYLTMRGLIFLFYFKTPMH